MPLVFEWPRGVTVSVKDDLSVSSKSGEAKEAFEELIDEYISDPEIRHPSMGFPAGNVGRLLTEGMEELGAKVSGEIKIGGSGKSGDRN